MALQLRRGTDAERQGITPKEGELIYATDTNRLWVGGKISPNQSLEQGGILVSGSLVNDTNPTLAENLDLNGNDITGNGNININGTITATGTVNLGDGVEDNVVVGGQIGSSLIPGTNNSYDLGASVSAWRTIYTSTIDAATSVNAGDVYIKGNISKDDSTVIYDGDTEALSVGNITSTGSVTATELSVGNITSGGSITLSDSVTATSIIATSAEISAILGDLKGSVFADDSTLIVDGITNTITADSVNTNQINSSSTESPIELQNDFRTPVQIKSVTDGALGGFPYTEYLSVRGTVDNPQSLAAGDIVGGWKVAGYDSVSGNGKVSTLWISAYESDAVVTDNYPKSTASLLIGKGGNTYNQFTFGSEGEFNAPGAITPGVFDDAAARDAGITTPTAGMMVFVTDIAKFQGYDGSAWVNLN